MKLGLMLFGFALLNAAFGQAQRQHAPGQWIPVGPDGGFVWVLAADPGTPSTIYAATGGGIFKTTDAGAHWAAMNSGLPVVNPGILTVDPQNAGTVYAVYCSAIYKTTDGAANWRFIGTVDSPICLGELAIVPGNPATLYLGGTGSGGVRNGLFKSTDGGATWTAVSSFAFGSYYIAGLVVDPQQPDTVYAGGRFDGSSPSSPVLFRSTDGSAAWSPASSGLPGGVGVLAMDPQNSLTLYAGIGMQVFKSTDGAGSWNPASVGLPPGPGPQQEGVPPGYNSCCQVLSLAISAQNPALIHALVHQQFSGSPSVQFLATSTDGAASWTTITDPLFAAARSLTLDPRDAGTQYLATSKGVLKTTDGGGQWTLANSGLRATPIQEVVVDSQSAGTLYAGGSGLFKSTDGGTSWIPSSLGLPSAILGLVADPQDPRTLYALGGGPNDVGLLTPNDFGLFKSQDAGGSWTEIYSNPISLPLVIAPQNPNILYAVCCNSLLSKSLDRGSTWIPLQPALGGQGISVAAIAVDPQDSNIVYAGTLYGDYDCLSCVGALWKSADGGVSWSEVPGTDGSIGAIVIDPRSPATIYYVDLGGLLRKSTDGGQTWTATQLPDCCGAVLAMDPQNPGTLYYSGNAGVSQSTDAGASWRPVGLGLIGHVNSLALDPRNPGTLYAATSSGLFVTTLQPAALAPLRPK